MLVYVDESYRKADEPNCKSTFAAVCIQEERYRAFDTDLFKLKKHYWKIQESLALELKGRLLLSQRAIELPKNREFIRQLVALMREYRVVPFAVVQDGSLQLSSIKGDYLPNLYRNVLRRVDRYMVEKHPDKMAVLFYDSVDHETNRKIAVSFNNFMFKHQSGVQLQHVLPVLNFSDSLVTPGIQVADVLAYCVNERYRERAGLHDSRGHLEEFFQEFRGLTFNDEHPDEGYTVWGFGFAGLGRGSTPTLTSEITDTSVQLAMDVEEDKEGES
jgi:hypothetical protein